MKSPRRTMMAAALAAPAAMAAKKKSSTRQSHWKDGRPKDGKTPLYSPAVTCNGFVFVSGTGKIDGGTIQEQTKYVLDSLEANLKHVGSSMEKAVKCNVFLSDINNYAAMNEVYRGRFGENPPARTTVAVAAIPFGCLVEIEVIAEA
ncbi:MAG TPA: RidA family protein [Bryobacteraceae bacterium]|nr:RidA family protein [Bryobacteraceae bacterium]